MRNREKRIAIIAGICILLLVGDRFVLTPILDGWNERSQKIVQLEESLAASQNLLDQESRWNRWEENFTARLLPESETDAESTVLKVLDQTAAAAGVSISTIRPRWKEQDKAPSILEVQIHGNGTMKQVTTFVYGLESNPISIAVEQFEVGSRSTKSRTSELSFTLRLTGLTKTNAHAVSSPQTEEVEL